ncbi:uncharacterized protein LOC119682853 [Teleopsis dalmanni]|uniref:uncharacterized protein LOC119682853 n=1 Tax=Teleopsis dalmanni TaxID=139649 RepID=UPI0018CF47E1|nr:uncharacterized protein LOC119682853 [Teleopsis dalmanni]
MFSLKLFLYVYGLLSLYIALASSDYESRRKRFLIFPRQAPTRHQFIIGLGIPTDLTYESLTSGYLIKAEFWLPYNATVFRENPFWPEYTPDLINARQNSLKRSSLRWTAYNYIEKKIDSYGFNGKECLLRIICEGNSVKFSKYELYAELVHIFLSPKSSLDLETPESTDYVEAAAVGERSGSCKIYNCEISFLNLLSYMDF